MNAKPLSHRSDIRPLEFTLAVLIGGIGSAVLSALLQSPWISVGFALIVMGTVSFMRWRIASEHKDSESLEAFAEDVYLLGYLLTLAALLGLAPRLMKEDSNLFHIAGVKLFTTIAGLGVMMSFRQLARRWAEERGDGELERFQKQEESFRAAVARLNRSAEELTAKMEEIVLRFDPDLLGSVTEWSNRAANAFSGATRAFEAIPGATEPGIRNLNALSGNIESLKLSISNLATALTSQLGVASVDFSRELGQAGTAARDLVTSVALLAPATEAGRSALEKMGTQAIREVDRLDIVNRNLGRIAAELARVEDSMKQLGDSNANDVTAPLNLLVQALAVAAEKVLITSDRMEHLHTSIQAATAASQELGQRLGKEVAKPLEVNEGALKRVHDQLAGAVHEIGRLAQQMDIANKEEAAGTRDLIAELGAMNKAVRTSNSQIHALVAQVTNLSSADDRSNNPAQRIARDIGKEQA